MIRIKVIFFGKTIDREVYEKTNWDYKDFKLKFWNIIPDNKLKFLQSYINGYIINFEKFEEYKDNLSVPFF